MAGKNNQLIIEIDKEFLVVLNRLEEKIKKATWDGLERISKKSLTRILARKINASKIV